MVNRRYIARAVCILSAALATTAIIGPSSGAGEETPQVSRPAEGGVGAAPSQTDVSAYFSPLGQPQQPGVPRGRYSNLLKQISVPNDRISYGDFCDFGYYAGTSYAGHTDLPPGYWVYLHPNWYIFQSVQGEAPVKTNWSPLQATGKPDTAAGDLPTAWASASADGQREWLDLTYEAPVEAVGVMVYENHGPGALDLVIAFAGNEEIEVWSGKDPTDRAKPSGVSVVGFSTPITTNRIRIHLDSPAVPGWNEIDAVGLIGSDGTVHWAKSATSSSTYGVVQVEPEALPASGIAPLRLP
jgi:hypothetical protein